MRTGAAVLERMGAERPYADSAPLSVEEVELAPPGPGELLVRIEAAGICHSDLSVVDGNRPRPLPMVLGHEAAGIVEEAGAGVTDLAPGDRVVLTFVPACGACPSCSAGRPALCGRAAAANRAGTLLGGERRLSRDGLDLHHHLGVSAFAERAVVSRGSAVAVPADVPPEVAALLGCAVLTGVGAVLNTAGVRPGETVAVLGLGGVGLAAVMAAVATAATPVVAVDPIEAKRELARELGADAAVHPDQLEETVDTLSPGGFDHCLETAGRAEVLAAAYRATRAGGNTVAVGLPHPSSELALPAVSFAGEGRRLLGSYMGDAAPHRDIPRLLRLWRAGRLPVERLHTGSIPLDSVNQGLDALADGTAVRQIIRPSEKEEA